MYDRTFWQDHIVDEQGQVLVQGTNLSEDNFNNIEKGVFENRVIELFNAQMNSLVAAENLEYAICRVEGGTVTQNGTTIKVAFNSVRNNTNYEVIPVVGISSGLTNYQFNITAKQANGFLCDVFGEFTSVTVYFLVKGGIL